MMDPFYCSGCGRMMGWTPNRFPGYKFCQPWEANLPNITEFEERNSLLVELLRDGYVMREAAEAVGITRQRGQQIVRARTAANYDLAS